MTNTTLIKKNISWYTELTSTNIWLIQLLCWAAWEEGSLAPFCVESNNRFPLEESITHEQPTRLIKSNILKFYHTKKRNAIVSQCRVQHTTISFLGIVLNFCSTASKSFVVISECSWSNSVVARTNVTCIYTFKRENKMSIWL
jgi:hypothetical protein